MAAKPKDIRSLLIEQGVKNLKVYGYPNVNAQNILTDRIFAAFFMSMLESNLGHSKDADVALNALIAEVQPVAVPQ